MVFKDTSCAKCSVMVYIYHNFYDFVIYMISYDNHQSHKVKNKLKKPTYFSNNDLITKSQEPYWCWNPVISGILVIRMASCMHQVKSSIALYMQTYHKYS